MSATITIPAACRAVPELDVDTASIGELAQDLLVASTQIDDVGEVAGGSARVPDWTGAGSSAYHAWLGPFGYRADAMSLALRRVGRRVEDHQTEMTRLLDLRGRLAQAVGQQMYALDDFERRVRVHVNNPPGADADPASYDATTTALQQESRTLDQALRNLDEQITSWETDVDTEETAMAAAFRQVMTTDQVEDRYGGVADPADAPLSRMPPESAGPAAAREWWESLTPAEREAIMTAAPGAIGNRDGIPAVARDEANRVSLDRDLELWEGLGDDRTPEEDRQLENAAAAQDALEEYEGERDPNGNEIPSMLWMYDPDAFGGDGRVAVSIGDPDTADNVAVNVPGLTTDGREIGQYTDQAFNLHQSATTADPSQTYASIAWIGYDAPNDNPFTGDSARVLGEGAAEDGGALLADSLNGLNAARDDDFNLIPIGHSYGSTTLGHALTDHDVDVDRAAVVGSPGLGSGVDGPGDLDVPEGQFYVGRNSDDGVSGLAGNGWAHLGPLGLGYDPSDVDFGANRFQAEDSSRNGTNDFGDSHTSYYDPNTESLSNLGIILSGGEPEGAEGVHDPFFPSWGNLNASPEDPEADRDVTHPQTTP